MDKLEIRNSDIFLAAESFLELGGDFKSPLSFHVFHLTGGETLLSDEDADRWLSDYYPKLGVDYENDSELTGIFKLRETVLHALKKGRITVHGN